MFGIGRTIVLVILAFVAGMLYERSDAATICQGSADWGAFFECALAEMI